MAKLKCDLHKRRVFFLKGKMIHRGGWGDICKGETASIGGETYTAKGVEQFGLVRPPRSVSPDKITKALREDD